MHLLLPGEVGAGDDEEVLHDRQKHSEAVVFHHGRANGRVQLLRIGQVDRLLIAVRVLDLEGKFGSTVEREGGGCRDEVNSCYASWRGGGHTKTTPDESEKVPHAHIHVLDAARVVRWK